MQKVNEIFGKEVINQVSGEKIATVHDIVMDRDTRHVLALLIRAGGLMGSTSVVRWSSVVSVGDVVVIRAERELPALNDDAEVSELAKQANRITGTPVISDKGEQLGSVGDMFINERGEVVGYEVKQGLLHSNRFLPAENVQAVGKDAVISTLAELPREKDLDNDQQDQHEPAYAAEPPAPAASTYVTEPVEPAAPVYSAESVEPIRPVEPAEGSQSNIADTERA